MMTIRVEGSKDPVNPVIWPVRLSLPCAVFETGRAFLFFSITQCPPYGCHAWHSRPTIQPQNSNRPFRLGGPAMASCFWGRRVGYACCLGWVVIFASL
jgi:hypothetical protein